MRPSTRSSNPEISLRASVRRLKPYYDPDTYRYFVIEKQSGGAWQPAHEDGDPYTAFDWVDSSTLGNGASTVTVSWLLRNADPGTYRVVYHGLAKAGASSYMPFHGASGSFVVR